MLMKALRIRNNLVVLDNINRVTFEENDADITADNQCGIYFVGSGNDPMVIRGGDARKVYEQIAEVLGAQD